MTRTTTTTQTIAYEFTRLEILEAMRELIQERYPGGAIVDGRNHSQQCEFLGPNDVIAPVVGLRISTTYEQPASDPAVPNRDA